MTSPILWMRAGVAGIALCVAAPALAQDIRNIPQKTDTTVTGPVAQPKAQSKQGGGVQGPPAPLETQLRDTPPDDLIVPQQSQPRLQTQPQPVQVRPVQPQPGASRQQSRTAPSAQTPTQTVPRQAMPATRVPAAAVAGTSPSSEPASPANDDQSVASPTVDAPLVEPRTQVTPEPSYLPSIDSSATELAPVEAAPTDEGPKWPWVLGGLLIVGLGGAFMMRRRPAAAGGFELGQTPWRDELDKDAPLPDTTIAKPVGRRLPDVKIPQAPGMIPRAAAPVVAPPPPPPSPEPVKAAVNESGLIVSRVRRPVEMEPGNSVMTEPMQAPPPAPAAPQPAETRVANDGRIVSGRRASEFGGPAPTPKRKRPRKELPGGGGMSFGYKVQR